MSDGVRPAKDMPPVRYAIALTSALLLGGATATLALQPAANAQVAPGVAQNEPGMIAATAPKSGAPMSFADMVARLQPAVVNISTNQTVKVAQQQDPSAGIFQFFGLTPPGGGGGGAGPATREAQSLGSGFVISADGYVVTNNHVISAGARNATVDSITVTLPDRREYKATLVGRDVASDLAVLKIDAGRSLPFVKFGDSTRARVGDWVVAIGNPFGLGSTVTAGIVSALHRVTGQQGAYDRFIQTDASINQGNSGGPMFNLNGDVIGINSQILSPTGGNVGIGFAIPAEDAKPIIDTLVSGGKIARGYIGIGLGGPVNDDVAAALGIPKNQGEVIARVEPAGPAARGGLKAGDVVTQVNGAAVNPDATLSRLIANVKPGSVARLAVLRDGKPVAVSVTVATRPSEDALAATLGGGEDDGGFGSGGDDSATAPAAAGGPLGVVVQPLTTGIASAVGVPAGTQGVVVSAVDPTSDAGQKLKRGDVISQVNGTPVRTADDVTRVVAAAKAAGRPQVLVFLQRGKTANGVIAVKLKG